MEEIKSIIDDLGNDALESSIKVAGVAVVSNSGKLIYQTSNWDLSNEINTILNVVKGERSFILLNYKYSVVETTPEGIVGTNDSGMGYILFVLFQGGVLVSYAMPGADPLKALSFLKTYAIKLNGKI